MQKLKFIIDDAKVRHAMGQKGIKSIEQLANALGVHRNTVTPYLAGQRGLPDCLDRLLDLLELTPAEAIITNARCKHLPGLEIAPLVSCLVQMAPENAYILFGSRAKGTARRYSDYDLGVYSSDGIPFPRFSRLIDLADAYKDDKHYDVNLTNFSLSDEGFLSGLRGIWHFLGGSLAAWIAIQKRAGVALYE